jgi:hypothetical protein
MSFFYIDILFYSLPKNPSHKQIYTLSSAGADNLRRRLMLRLLLKRCPIPRFSMTVVWAIAIIIWLVPRWTVRSVPSPCCVTVFQSNTPKIHRWHRWDRRNRPCPNDKQIIIYIISSGNGQNSSNKWCLPQFSVISGWPIPPAAYFLRPHLT